MSEVVEDPFNWSVNATITPTQYPSVSQSNIPIITPTYHPRLNQDKPTYYPTTEPTLQPTNNAANWIHIQSTKI